MFVRSTLLFVFALGIAATFGAPMLFAGREPAGPAPSASTPKPLPVVSVAPAAPRDLAPTADFTARLEASQTVEVRPRVSGHVAEVRFQAGQQVAAAG